MKSEERHELKSNELEKLTAKVQSLFQRYGMQIALGVSAIILVAAAVMFWNRTTAANQTAGWAELMDAGTTNSTARLIEVAETEGLSGKPVVAWARLQAAEGYLETGIQQSIEGREGDRGLVSDLGEARKNFEAALAAAPAKSAMQERALYGLGRCLETMAGVAQRTDAENSNTVDLLDEAAKAYEKLITEFPNTPYNQKRYEEQELGKLERHLAYLKSEKASEFYAWFRTQKPKKKDRPGPFDSLTGGGRPPFRPGPVTLPSIPDGLRLPDLPAEESGNGPAFPDASSDPADGEKGGSKKGDTAKDNTEKDDVGKDDTGKDDTLPPKASAAPEKSGDEKKPDSEPEKSQPEESQPKKSQPKKSQPEKSQPEKNDEP